MGNNNIEPLENNSRFDNDNLSGINQNNINNSNFSKISQNPKNIINFLIKAEGNILLSNLNKSISISFNNLNILINNQIKNNLLENQLKYIQLIDDHIDIKTKGNLNYPYNRAEYNYKKIINEMSKNDQNNKITYQKPNNNYNNYIVFRKNFKENEKSEKPENAFIDFNKKEQLKYSNFSTTIGSKSDNNNGNKPVKQIKVFKIGKSEDFIIQPNNNSDNNNLNNQEKIFYNNSERIFGRAESPSSLQTFSTSSTTNNNNNEQNAYKNPLPSDRVFKINNNNVIIKTRKDSNNINTERISSPQNFNYKRLLSPSDNKIMIQPRNKSPKNNERNKNKLIEKKNINNNINNINKNINNVKITNTFNIEKETKNKNNININLSPKDKKIKKINVKIYPNITRRAVSPIQTKINADNSFELPGNNFEISPFSDDENNSYKYNKKNLSNLNIKPKYKITKDKNSQNNSYIQGMKNKKKNIIQMSPYKQKNNKIIAPNKNGKCITIENNSYKKKELFQIISKNPLHL